MMKILIPVDHAVGISGPHRNVVGSLNALTARDDVTVVLVTGKVDPDEPYARSKNIDIRLGYLPHQPGKWFTNLRLLHTAAKGCDIIYVPTNLKSLLYAQSVRFKRPLVAGPNVTHLPIHNKHDSPGKIELKILSDAWFENSRLRQAHVRRMSGVSSIGYIHHAIDLERFSPNARQPEIWNRYDVPNCAQKIVFVGRDNEYRKGVAQLLDAIAQIARAGRSDLHFVLIGNLAQHTRAYLKGMPNATYLGFRSGDELATLYASADLCVVPSSWESFGFTLLEAMASGLPVICSRIEAFTEIADTCGCVKMINLVGQDGRFRPESSTALAQAIICLADNPERRCQLGSNARRSAEEHFSETRLGNDLIKLFDAVLQGRS